MRSDASRNHEAIVTAAIAVLAASPNASMHQIAEASGTGRTTLYRHFPDRRSLVDAIMERVLREADAVGAEHFDAAEREDRDPVVVLGQLSGELSNLGDRYRFLQAHTPDPAAAATTTTTHVRRGAGELRFLQYVRSGQASGRLRDDLTAEWVLDVFGAIVARSVAHRFRSAQARAEAVSRTVEGLVRPVG